MNGEWLGSRAIRVNWANQKTQTGTGTSAGGGSGGGMGRPGGGMSAPPSNPSPYSMSRATPMASSVATPSYASPPPPAAAGYDGYASQGADTNSTVYVGNLIPYTTQADLIPLFQGYGYIVEIRMQADRGFAFVKLDTHQHAAMAITNLQNQLVHGRPIKCSWGKDKEPGSGAAPPAQQPGQYAYPYQQYPYYGGYYGQGGVPGQPGQAQQGQEGQQTGAWDPAAAAAYYQQGGWGGYYQGELFRPYDYDESSWQCAGQQGDHSQAQAGAQNGQQGA